MSDPARSSNTNWRKGAILALGTGVIYALGLYLLIDRFMPNTGLVGVAFLLGVPIAVPSLSIIIWDPHGSYDVSKHVSFGLLSVTVMIVAGFVVLREAGICLLMASPLFYGAGAAGSAGIAYVLRHRERRALSLALVLMPAILLPVDGNIRYPSDAETVTSAVEIGAPPSVVWRTIASVRNIRPEELGWTFTQDVVGVPKPIDARLSGSGVGAVRYAKWGGGVHFQERITEWTPGERMAWNFEFSPDSLPRTLEGHIKLNSDYLKLAQGSYTLAALPHGRTHLTLQTRYWMRTPFNIYCALWGRLFIGDFHRNVLCVVRERSEKPA